MQSNARIIIIAVVLALLLFVVGVLVGRYTLLRPQGEPTDTTQQSQTVSEVPSDTKIPELGATDVAAGVAVPTNVTAAAPGVDAKFRGFTVNIEGDKFSPETIIVKQGDTTSIKFTSVDKAYDFTQPDYGLFTSIPKGVTKLVEFGGVNPGKYTYYCKSCGGPEKGPVGYIVVVPK